MLGERVRSYWPLLAVVAVAFVVRLAVLAFVHPICSWGDARLPHDCYILTGDTEYVVFQAQALLDGHGFADAGRMQFGLDGTDVPGAAHPPLFTLVMAGWKLVGIDSVHGWRVAMSLVGSVGAGLLGLAAWRLAAGREATTAARSRHAGLLAGLMAACSPLLWTRDTGLLVEALLVPLVALAVLVGLRLWRAATLANGALLGLVVGLAWLARSEQVLLLLGAVPVVLYGHRGVSLAHRLEVLGVAGVVAALCMAPWTIHNLGRFEEPVPLSTNGGLALLFGSCDETYYGDAFAYYDWLCVDALELDPTRDASIHEGERFDAAVDYMRAHPRRTLLVGSARVGRLWRVYAPLDTTRREATQEKVGRMGAWANLLALLGTAPLAAVGAAHLRRQRAPIGMLLAPIAISSVAALLLIPLPRFRVPADATMVVLAAFGVIALRERIMNARAARLQSGVRPTGQVTPVPPRPQ